MKPGMYYIFSHEEERRILHKDGLSAYSNIYADGKIEEPVYVREKDNYYVKYHVEKKGKIDWVTKEFKTRSAAYDFYLRKYREYMYEWTLMFYEEFKPNNRSR